MDAENSLHLRTVFLVSSLALGSLLASGDVAAQQLTVSRIIDGDTFELSDGRTVRLIGIDTPEVHASAKLTRDARRTDRDRQTIQALGRLASKHAAELVADRPVALEFDPANATQDHRDRYGRVLGYVWVLDESGRRLFSVNERLLADGYANAYTNYPFKHAEKYLDLQRAARSDERGLWDPSLALDVAEDRDCGDFSTHAEAQQFYIEQGGPEYDPHRLDRDANGAACEGLRRNR